MARDRCLLYSIVIILIVAIVIGFIAILMMLFIGVFRSCGPLLRHASHSRLARQATRGGQTLQCARPPPRLARSGSSCAGEGPSSVEAATSRPPLPEGLPGAASQHATRPSGLAR